MQRTKELTPVSVVVVITTILTILTTVITGTAEVGIVEDVIMEIEILATAITDPAGSELGRTKKEKIKVAEVAEDAEDMAEEMEIDPKVMMHAQFMEGTSGASVFSIPTGTTTDQGTVIVTETAQGEVTPTM